MIHHNPRIALNGLILLVDACNKRSYTGTGTIWHDISTIGNDGILIGGPTFSASNYGILQFNGSTNYAALNEIPNITTELTYIAWINPTSLSGNKAVISVKGTLMEIQSTGYQYWSDIGAAPNALTTSTINLNNWYAVAITQAGTSINSYLNGVYQGSATGTSIASGTSKEIASFGGTRLWEGSIASVYVYNRALSDIEILQNYNAIKTRFGLI